MFAFLLFSLTVLADVCYPEYECKWSTYDYASGTLYEFDFSTLCSPLTGSTVSDAAFTYHYNLCGRTPRYCLPLNGAQTFSRGTMIQFANPDTPPLPACVRRGNALAYHARA